MDFLFDIGNVIVGFDFKTPLLALIPENTPDKEQRVDQVLQTKDEFEAGRIPAEKYFAWAAETLQHQGTMEEFLDTWRNIFEPITPMWQKINELHSQGHNLYLFSNIQEIHITHLLDTYPIFKKFSGGIYSYNTGHVKPEPPIYQLAIDTFKLTPEKTIYIDDLPANINAGKEAGFITHLYDKNNHSNFLNWLKSL